MINSNGKFVEVSNTSLDTNRGYAYGDALFETIRVNAGEILFWEDHYFRLMAAMRILRMQIPMQFTPEFLETEIQELIQKNSLTHSSARVKIMVHRVSGGRYSPQSNEIEYIISTASIQEKFYSINPDPYEVTLYKDHYVSPDLLSTLKTNNKIINVLGSIFAKENGFDNCLLMNTNKMVVEALQGNLFLVKDTIIKTPPTSDGCLKGVFRKQLINIVKDLQEYTLEEGSISPFELQKADELFITNVIKGIQPITKFRKKEYQTKVSKRLLGILNAQIRLKNN